MKDILHKLAEKHHIEMIGYTSANKFTKEKLRIEKRYGKDFISPFTKGDVESLTQPRLVWDKVESIISIGISYYTMEESKNGRDALGEIARVAWGEDYHHVLLKFMKAFMLDLGQYYPNLQYQCYVDNAPLLDRAVAYRSGLGFYGKNNFIIHPYYGSYIFLGHILINERLEENNASIQNACGHCNRCIEVCPTKALQEYDLNANKCISYLTQKKELLNRWERKAIGHHIYGCDCCQRVCPYNQNAILSHHEEFKPIQWLSMPSLEFIIHMSNKEFEQTYAKTSAGWRGKKLLQRNAIIVAGNIKNRRHKELLKQTIKDDRWDIRIYSMFSLLEYDMDSQAVVAKRLSEESDAFRVKFNAYKD
ncbi:MAG: tRNA epoxyqueuosine(34) reductase QueG [Eubacteriales bacterium]